MAMRAVPYFESDEFDARTIGDEQLREFAENLRRDGVAILDLGDEVRMLCDQVTAETRHYFERGASRVQDAWRRSRAAQRMACLPQVLRALEAVYGRRPFPFQTLNFEVGTQQALHSDMIHFSSQPERFMCGVWVALEDIEEDAGPLTYVRGSHRLPFLTMEDAGISGLPGYGDYPRYEAALAERLAESNMPQLTLCPRKGEAVVWAANVAHGGSRIERPGATRRSMVTHYYFDDCLYFTPMRSDIRRDHLYVRAPADISQGGWPRLSRRDGRIAWPSAREMAGGMVDYVLRRPFVAAKR